MKCPYCKEIIDDDSRYCDQCGKELMFCPECRQPRRGTTCAACGADLVNAASLRGAEKSTPTLLEGDGFKLTLKEGVFGRTTGIYPEFSNQIYISGRHGELRCEKGQWQVRDLGSHNGTLLNGMKLVPNGWYDLHLGDQLKIATTLLTVK